MKLKGTQKQFIQDLDCFIGQSVVDVALIQGQIKNNIALTYDIDPELFPKKQVTDIISEHSTYASQVRFKYIDGEETAMLLVIFLEHR